MLFGLDLIYTWPKGKYECKQEGTKGTCIPGTGVKGDVIKLWEMKLEREIKKVLVC